MSSCPKGFADKPPTMAHTLMFQDEFNTFELTEQTFVAYHELFEVHEFRCDVCWIYVLTDFQVFYKIETDKEYFT